ncbi:MAG: hypothetical protein FIB07_03190 [Candidatus Methanoperedens sp.]|nr:hypothetical protein [Candidatus Methanoperedens sp.]
MNFLDVEKSDKVGGISESKIFKMCILYGMAGFGLIDILPYEIPLFLRVSIACILLGIPLLDFKKKIILGISGGLGYLIKDYIFWDLTDLKWWAYFGSRSEVDSLLIISLTGAIIGTFLGIALWNKKAIIIFPLCGAIAFFFGTVISFMAPLLARLFLSILFYVLSVPLSLIESLESFVPYFVHFGGLGAGAVFGAGVYLYLSSFKEIRTIFRTKVISFFIVILSLNILFILFAGGISGGHPPNFATIAPIGEAVERHEPYEQCTITINNYTFLPQDPGKGLNLNVGVTIKYCSGSPDIFLVYKQDEYPWGSGIITKYSSWNDPAWKQPENVRNVKIEPDRIYYRNYTFENVPSHLRTKDYAVVWLWMNRTEFGESGAFEHIIIQLE